MNKQGYNNNINYHNNNNNNNNDSNNNVNNNSTTKEPQYNWVVTLGAVHLWRQPLGGEVGVNQILSFADPPSVKVWHFADARYKIILWMREKIKLMVQIMK